MNDINEDKKEYAEFRKLAPTVLLPSLATFNRTTIQEVICPALTSYVMTDADVIVVGAGPAGATAAKVLAEAGNVSCLLLDKAKFPRPKVCAGGLLFHTFFAFPYVKECIENYNYALTVFAPRLDASLALESPDPLLAMTRGRADFDAHMVELAKGAGVDFRSEEKVLQVEVAPDHVAVTCAGGEQFSCKLVIGADSVNSIVARGVGLFARKAAEDMGIAMEEEFPLAGHVEEFFGPERRVYLCLHYGHLPGYGWVFPRADSINVGIGTSTNHGHELRAVLARLVADLKTKGILPEEVELASPKAAPLPSTLPNEAIYGNRTLLAGDAASFCSPITGEGIYYAMASGAIAGRVAADAIAQNNYSASFLARYNAEWKKSVGKELEFQYFAKRTVLASERRCGKAVEWGAADAKLRTLFSKFFLGSLDLQGLKRKMILQYLRCKVKEKLGMLKTNYTREEFSD